MDGAMSNLPSWQKALALSKRRWFGVAENALASFCSGAAKVSCAHSKAKSRLCDARNGLSRTTSQNLWESRQEAFLLCDTIFSTYAYRLADFFPEVARSRRIVGSHTPPRRILNTR
jgi:hypothetical protein